MNVRLTVLAATLACTTSAALAAVTPAGSAGGSLSIVDSGGFSWSLNLSPLFRVDPGTGNIVIDTSNIGPDEQGNWMVSANTAGVQVWDAAQDAFVTPAQLVRWHSWVRADGSVATETTPANPWRAQFFFAAGGNVDPYIAYGFQVRNTGSATQTYSYTQGQTMTPAVAPEYTIYADVSGSLVNTLTPTATAQIAPLSGAKVQQVRLGNSGVATVNAGVDLGEALSITTAGSTTYGTFAGTASGVGSFDYWTIGTTFTLTGGDIVTLSGYSEITAVPEPGTLGMLMAGVALVGFVARRRLGV